MERKIKGIKIKYLKENIEFEANINTTDKQAAIDSFNGMDVVIVTADYIYEEVVLEKPVIPEFLKRFEMTDKEADELHKFIDKFIEWKIQEVTKK